MGVTRLSVGVQSFQPAPAGGARPRRDAAAGARRRRLRAGGRVRGGLDRPDLRHPGPDPGRPRGRPGRGARAGPGPRLLVRARAEAGLGARAARPAGARRGRGRRRLPAHRRRARGRGLPLVRDGQLRPARPRVPPQPGLLGRRRLPRPGDRRRQHRRRPPLAQPPRRWRAYVAALAAAARARRARVEPLDVDDLRRERWMLGLRLARGPRPRLGRAARPPRGARAAAARPGLLRAGDGRRGPHPRGALRAERHPARAHGVRVTRRAPTIRRLKPRQELILRTVVEEHIATGTPVGSKNIAGRDGIDFASSTVRYELARLEELGFLDHPHTSAGPRSPRTGATATTWTRCWSATRPRARRRWSGAPSTRPRCGARSTPPSAAWPTSSPR